VDVPMVGQGDVAARDVNADEETLAATERFVRQYQLTIDRALNAARADGECRFPVKFEDGFQALLPHSQKMRQLVRLLSLRLQVSKAHSDKRQAIDALHAILAAARSQNQQMTIVEQLVALAIGGVALIEAEKLLGEMELNDEELARLFSEIDRLEIEQGLTRGLVGERAMGYHSFYHLGQLTGSNESGKPFPGEGQLTLPVDCRYFLEVMGESIEASRQPFPEALHRANHIDARFEKVMKDPLSKFSYTVTLLIVPALHTAFEVTAKNIAHRDELLCAIAAERYRLKHGQPPQKLADLVPEFLSAVPTDPFDGQPLRLKADGDGLAFYSVGKDRKDDGGQENNNSGEPDVVVTLKRRSK
jgi:hypothetical protein